MTVTGAGGSGKTRLALEVAARVSEDKGVGAYFVELAPIAEPAQVPGAVASALGVREQPGGPTLEVLSEALAGQDLLVVVDNCEHVIGAAAELAERLNRACPKLRVLTTSREPLGIEGERVYRLAPLSLPPEHASSLQDLRGSDAVTLFFERACAHDATFALEEPVAGLVASICRRLDGIPLALELAAARVPGMSLTDLDERLDQRFRVLTGGSRTALPRQRTLEATFDWSFQLLSPAEQEVLTRLSVFSGSFDLEAAEAVCATDAASAGDVADLVGSLVGKSLVMAERSAGSLRYSLLETVRHYGAEHLSAIGGEAALGRTRSAHAEHYLQEAERADLLGADVARWLTKFDLDWDNLRLALGYFLSQPGRAEEVLRMGAALGAFFVERNEAYGFDAVRTALARPDPIADEVRARALWNVGISLWDFYYFSFQPEGVVPGKAMVQEGLEIARRLGDQALLADILAGLSGVEETDRAQAVRYAEEALEIGRSLGDDRLIGNALGALGGAVAERAEKKRLFTEAVAHMRRAGDLVDCSWKLILLSALELADNNPEAAADLLEGDLAIWEEVEASGSAAESRYWPRLLPVWCVLADTRLFEGRFAEAAVWLRRALMLDRRLGRRVVGDMPNVICCVARLGDPGDAARLTGAFNTMLSWHVPVEYTYTEENPLAHLHFLRRARLQQTVVDLREALGDDSFEMLQRAGAKLSYKEAVDLAIATLDTRT